MTKYQEKLFEAIYFSNDCPDDDTMFISPNYKEWADLFEKWLLNIESDKSWKHIREEHDNCIIFSHGQEGIWFANDINVCPWIKTVFHCYIHSKESFRHEPV
jgi:hypothetical protein